MSESKTAVVIVAGGNGRRMNTSVRKQYLTVGELPVLVRTLNVFAAIEAIGPILLVIPRNDERFCMEAFLIPHGLQGKVRLVHGGEERQMSVKNGLEALKNHRFPEKGIVLIHDGVRPFVDESLIQNCIHGAQRHGACIPAIPVVDTLKRADDQGRVKTTVPRDHLYQVQTPQAFRFDLIMKAHDHAVHRDLRGTDDASLVEAMAGTVYLVPGSPDNIKLTTPEDMVRGERIADSLLFQRRTRWAEQCFRWCRRLFCMVTVLMALIFFMPSPSVADDFPDPLSSAMTEYLECYPIELLGFKNQSPTTTSRNLCLAVIYHKKGLSPLWVTARGPGSRAAVILDTLGRAYEEGLDPVDYGVELMTQLWHSPEPKSLARLDTLITFNLIKYVHDVSRGQIKLRYVNPLLFAEAGDVDFDPLATVDKALAVTDLAAYLASLPPAHRHYTNLKNALKIYRNLARQGGWEKIPSGKILRPGDSDHRIPVIMKRLAITGDIDAPVEGERVAYAAELVPSVKKFQSRHGLKPDGVVGPLTRRAMNVSVQKAIRRIVINMARWRWQEHFLGEKYILVNVASFDLSGFKDDELKIQFPVIVGKLQHQTPVFSDRVRYIDFNPYWNITPSIARREELPGLRKDPYHLVKRHIRLFSSWKSDAVELDSTTMDWMNITPRQISRFKLRQDPGPWNALGAVKFIFPNKYDVYMHDTPSQNLFNQNNRDFSHGCIRVSDPPGLALFILSDGTGAWTLEKIQAILDSGKRTVIRPEMAVPVHITYQTAWVDKNGLICFNKDIYGRDKKLLQALFSEDGQK